MFAARRSLGPRSPHVVGLLFVGAALVALAPGGCKKRANRTEPATPQRTGDQALTVAKVDDTVITLGDLEDRLGKQAPFVRARYAGIDKRKELLDNLIRFEIMAREAERRGYDQDPEVVRVMKQQMIAKFMQKDFESKLRIEDVPGAEVEQYYAAHPEEFNTPDRVRVSQVLVGDEIKANKVAAEARAANRADTKAFVGLVAKYSEDDDSKGRAGDLLAFDRNSAAYPKAVVEAAFGLKEVGDISAPVKSEKGYHILRLAQKLPGFSRPLTEVKRQIQQRLFRDLRTKSLDSFVADLRKRYTVTIDEANLAKLSVETGADLRAGHGPGMPPVFGHAPGAGSPAEPPGPPHKVAAPADKPAAATAPHTAPAPGPTRP